MDTGSSFELCDLAAEQVMRCADDPAAPASLFDVEPGSSCARVVASQLAEEFSIELTPGAPLTVWADGGGDVDPHWRERFPAREGSVYSQWLFLATLFPQDACEGYPPFDAFEWQAHSAEIYLRAS